MKHIMSTGLATLAAAAIIGESGQIGMVAGFFGSIHLYLWANRWVKFSWAWRDLARRRYLCPARMGLTRLHPVPLG